MLTVLTWKWGAKYTLEHVLRLQAGMRRHLRQAHRFVLVTDDPQPHLELMRSGLVARIIDPELIGPGCFCRLRMFDPDWQRSLALDERIVSMDLDTVITGQLDSIFDHAEPFLILMGANATNPCPYNGSLMMLRAGAHPEVWRDFSLDKARAIPFHDFPDDQGWIAHMLPNAAGWRAGRSSGIFAFRKPGWPHGSDDLPKGAKLVTFPGKRDPSQFTHLPWIQEHWRI